MSQILQCQIRDLNLQYVVEGEGTPVLNLHGWGGDHQYLAGFVEPFFEQYGKNSSRSYQRIYLDLPGGGLNRSVTPDWIQSSDELLEVVLEFIDQIIANRPFVIVGHSYGGYLARGVVKNRRENLRGVMLVVPVIVAENAKRTVPEHSVLSRSADLDTFLNTQNPEVIEWFEAMAVVQTPEVFARIRDEMLPGAQSGATEFLAKIRDTQAYAFSFDVDDLDQPFDKPTLIMMGRQDRTNGYQDGWSLINNYSRATFVVLDRSGHLLDAEQPVLLNSLANDWLSRVEELFVS